MQDRDETDVVDRPSQYARSIAYAEGVAAHDFGRDRARNPYSSQDLVLAVVWITGCDNAAREAVERSREPGEHQCPFCGAPAVGQTFLGYVCREHGGE